MDDMAQEIIPFRIEIRAEEIDDLVDRLSRTRWPEPETLAARVRLMGRAVGARVWGAGYGSGVGAAHGWTGLQRVWGSGRRLGFDRDHQPRCPGLRACGGHAPDHGHRLPRSRGRGTDR